MYYLKEMIGKENVNIVLRAFLDKFKYAAPPYPVSTDLIDEFRKQTSDSLQYIIDDLFWDITLFENRTASADAVELGDGKYEVSSGKLKADGQGKETAIALNNWMDIGAFARPEGQRKYGKTLYRKRVQIKMLHSLKWDDFSIHFYKSKGPAALLPGSVLLSYVTNKY